MVFSSERKKKKRNKIIWIIVFSVIVIIGVSIAAWTSFASTISKYGVEDKSAVYEKNKAIASQAYIYGSPSIEMYRYFYDMAVDKTSKFYSRLNKFLHITKWSQPEYTTFLNNDADTLNSVAWLDLTREPVVILCPDTSDRYYSLEILDFYNNCSGSFYKSPTDPSKCNFLITLRDWDGRVPSDTQQIIVDTPYVLAYVKLMVPASNELKRVKETQAKFDIRPLSRYKDTNEYEGTYLELPELKIESAIDFYNTLNFIMSINPPPENEDGLIGLFSQIGVFPGNTIIESELSKEELSGINAGYDLGIRLRKSLSSDIKVPLAGGFNTVNASDAYSGNYYRRTALADLGLKIYNPQYFLELSATFDKDGLFLNGKNNYEIYFASPPPCVEGWSLTLYKAEDGTLISNESNVYKIGSRSEYLKFNSDDSLSIFVSTSSPSDKSMINNWLPSSEDDFILILRLYLPKQEILAGEWSYPQIIKR